MAADDQLFQRFGREFPKGHVLFRDGEPGREMYVVQSGKVNITKTMRGSEIVLATLGPGKFLGEMALLLNKPRSAGAVMAEDGRLLVVDPKNFEAMIRGSGEIAARLIKELADRLKDADEQIENLMLRDPSSRVIHYLVRQAERRGTQTPNGTLVSINLLELPSRMGLHPEEVQETVAKAARARIFALVPDGVMVPDIKKALQYLEFLEMKEKFHES
jgi:CRP/FNR family cyclic AMP-dependent transcriptional regulator